MTGDSNIVEAFSEDQVVRLTGISVRQLRYWDQTDFFKPTFAEPNRRVAFSRIYSFTDLVSLRVLNELRNEFGVSLQHLRGVARGLNNMSEDKWGSMQLFVVNRQVILAEPDTNTYREIVSRQHVFPMALAAVYADTRKAVDSLKRRGEDNIGKMAKSRNICHNSLVIAGTRIPVHTVKQFAEAGYSVSQIRDEYPTLTETDIQAAIEYEGNGIAA